MASRLEIVNGEVATKRGRMGELLALRKARGDGASFTDEERNEFVKLNGELTPLVKEQEALQLVEKAATETEAYLNDNLPTGSNLPQPSSVKTDLLGEIKLKDASGNYRPESEIKEELDRRAHAKAAELMLAGATGGGALDTPERRVEVKAAAIAMAFIGSDAFKKYSKVDRAYDGGKALEVDFQKALLDTSAYPIQSIRSNIILPLPTRRLVVADLMPQGNITQPRFFVRGRDRSYEQRSPGSGGRD
jgi:hypothetical protein